MYANAYYTQQQQHNVTIYRYKYGEAKISFGQENTRSEKQTQLNQRSSYTHIYMKQNKKTNKT